MAHNADDQLDGGGHGIASLAMIASAYWLKVEEGIGDVVKVVEEEGVMEGVEEEIGEVNKKKNASLREECNSLSLPHATLTRVPALHCCSCNIIITINNISKSGKNRIFSRVLFFPAHVELVTVLVVVLVFEILSARCSFFFYYNIVLLCFLHSINFACKLTTFHKSVAFLC